MTGQSNYSDLGHAFAEQILDIGRDANNTHFLIHYTDDDDSWILMYPLAFDVWLGLDTFPNWVHESQSKWYANHSLPYGLQYRNSLRYTLLEWQMWVAAIVSDEVRDHVVNAVHKFYSRETGPGDSVPGPTQWVIVPGDDEGRWTFFSKAKSVVGSIYMIAAVQGGFNSSYLQAKSPPAPKSISSALNVVDFTIQDPNMMPLDNLADIFTFDRYDHDGQYDKYDIPYDVPVGASRPVTSSFLGLSFDTASFPKYVGG